ncbi:hypothetical protein SAMN03159444_03515 [Pseudomonas sp. NFACC02]|uniref:DUF2515 family protein n=1 Tax=Pseudomonas sp. NFACC02 TaxID=1566250 RepID=UPI0008CD2E19|nr:hypothetical protein [Pseudomonas sp. NFACC02]SER21180.1 hypothetical protein SAMN03159444_03515 [Pseudomonas sp. NFACC02]
MTQCFRDHPSDTQVLNQSTRALADCDTRFIYRDGEKYPVTEIPILTGEGLWRIYQREAESIVAPDGVLIADPVARNRAINAAYARLWLHDQRFQWAGLAAFASKQVGCGLLHARSAVDHIQQEDEALKHLRELRAQSGLLTPGQMEPQAEALDRYRQADAQNPVPSLGIRGDAESPSLTSRQFQHVYEMMALGNTTLFLDIFPLHAFYAKRGLAEFRECLKQRANIYGHSKFPVLWPVAQETLRFGQSHKRILLGFEAIDRGDIVNSVEHLAWHEQANILQPTMYSDTQLVMLLRGNHFSYVTGFPSGVAQAIEVTLANQCQRLGDGRTLEFSRNPLADLSDIEQRMPFVLRAANRFNELLNSDQRPVVEQSIKDIAAGAPLL